MRRHVARAAGIGVVAPGAADVVGPLEDDEVVDRRAACRRIAVAEAGEAGADDDDAGVPSLAEVLHRSHRHRLAALSVSFRTHLVLDSTQYAGTVQAVTSHGFIARRSGAKAAPLPPARACAPETVDGVDHRARLLAGVAEAAATKGYAATTVADIVGRAQVSRRTF